MEDVDKRRVDKGDARVDPRDGTVLEVSLPPLALRQVSGLLERGRARRSPDGWQLLLPGEVTGDPGSIVGAEFPITTLVRWVGFTALAAAIGSLAVDLFVLPRAAAVEAARQHIRRTVLACLGALVVTTIAELVIRGRTMAGGDLAAAMAAMPAVLSRTHFGTIWALRGVALGLALGCAVGRSRPARAMSLGLVLAVALTTSLTGHAADWGDFSLSAGVDWLHVVASGAWAGGLLCLGLVVLARARTWPAEILGVVIGRFSRLAGWCLLAVVLTGAYNAWAQLPNVSAVWTTTYGRILALKLLLVLGLVWWGAVNRYTIVPRLGPRRAAGAGVRCFRLARFVALGSSRVGRGVVRGRLFTYLLREAVLAIAVLGSTAALVDSDPPRHAGHHHGEPEAEPGPFRVTMEELHAQGGVPKGWSFALPAGDPAQGREVFARLGCFACHKVSGEKFPASVGVGPDLTGAGAHHPAGYLLESILNPNAVVVEGPGYTGPDGRSIMPDYRGQISAAELVDLVAYLKSL